MKSLKPRNLIGFVLLLISIGLLVPGLINDLLTLEASFVLPLLGKQTVLEETRSIVGTIGNLAENGHGFVAFLILFFSVIVPLAKALIMCLVALSSSSGATYRMHKFVGIISKWSMADVFVVGVFIAFLSIKANDQISATLHSGFYLFTAYCITSIIAVQLIQIPEVPKKDTTG
ncbi:MAG: hypothetical protein RLZZ165_856 [Bacteroidota bacterium]|jgi:uncharacterized paraquat-inducible protein A